MGNECDEKTLRQIKAKEMIYQVNICNGWMDTWTNGWIHGLMDGWTCGLMDGYMD